MLTCRELVIFNKVSNKHLSITVAERDIAIPTVCVEEVAPNPESRITRDFHWALRLRNIYTLEEL